MLSFESMPRQGATRWDVFCADQQTAVQAGGWKTWTKPPGCSWVYILMIGAGGGGGRGAGGSVATVPGPGGAASGGTLIIPAIMLPDTLYIRPGKGGAGGASASTAGAAGDSTDIALYPSNATNQWILMECAGAGGGAAVTTVGTGGSALFSASPWTKLGLLASWGGTAGVANNNIPGVNPTCPGVSGGNGATAGSNQSAIAPYPVISGGAGTTGGAGGHGLNANKRIDPLMFNPSSLLFTGGAGGGGITTVATAGAGGNGAYGCGGGGGGTGNIASAVSGNGGNGGDGLVIIGAF
jgi:hypothetical protein